MGAVDALPSHERRAVVRLHPDDAALCKKVLNSRGQSHARLDPDPDIERGGCIVTTGASHVDATVGARIEALACSLLDQPRAWMGADNVAESIQR